MDMQNHTTESTHHKMASIKTHCAGGEVLNWLVARAIGTPVAVCKGMVLTPLPCFTSPVLELGLGYKPFRPVSNWQVGGPIKNQYRISTMLKHSGIWVACIYDVNDEPTFMTSSTDELEAAMRCLVLARLGTGLQVPTELIQQPSAAVPKCAVEECEVRS